MQLDSHSSDISSEKAGRIDALVSNRSEFDAFVYTSIDDALEELRRRKDDPRLTGYLQKNLPFGLPESMHNTLSVVLFRHIATPNYEIQRFIMLSSLIVSTHSKHEKDRGLRTLILEYLGDKFTNRNEWKYSLGRLFLNKGKDKNGSEIFESRRIIDFNASNNQPISSIQTSWGQPLVDFHHEAFEAMFPSMRGGVADLTEWLHQHGEGPRKFYKHFLSMFLRDGILLENFMLNGTELTFTKDVILPVIMEIYEETGLKPLIVALEPTTVEHERFWLSHPHTEMKRLIDGKESGSTNA